MSFVLNSHEILKQTSDEIHNNFFYEICLKFVRTIEIHFGKEKFFF